MRFFFVLGFWVQRIVRLADLHPKGPVVFQPPNLALSCALARLSRPMPFLSTVISSAFTCDQLQTRSVLLAKMGQAGDSKKIFVRPR